MANLYTIGYEGKNIEEFIKTLQDANISILLDVRENPNSRKKGFSKKSLSEALQNYGITYLHLPELGNPKEIRVEFHEDGDINKLFEKYRSYIKENPGCLNTLIDKIENNNACIMCFEKSAAKCHRMIIGEYLFLQKGVAIRHL